MRAAVGYRTLRRFVFHEGCEVAAQSAAFVGSCVKRNRNAEFSGGVQLSLFFSPRLCGPAFVQLSRFHGILDPFHERKYVLFGLGSTIVAIMFVLYGDLLSFIRQ